MFVLPVLAIDLIHPRGSHQICVTPNGNVKTTPYSTQQLTADNRSTVFGDDDVDAVTTTHPAERGDLAAKQPIPPSYARLFRATVGWDAQVNRYAATRAWQLQTDGRLHWGRWWNTTRSGSTTCNATAMARVSRFCRHEKEAACHRHRQGKDYFLGVHSATPLN